MHDLQVDVPLCLSECDVPDGIDAAYLSIRRLELRDCTIGSEKSNNKALDLSFAQVRGGLDLSGTTLRSGNAATLDGRNAVIAGDVVLGQGLGEPRKPRYYCRSDAEGAIVFVFSHIKGSLLLNGVDLRSESGPALNISSAMIEGDANLRGQCEIKGSSETGAVQVVTTMIKGQLELGDSSVSNGIGPALNLRGVRVTEDLFARKGFRAEGCTHRGVIRLFQAKIGGRVLMESIRVKNVANREEEYGPALDCGDIRVGRGFSIQRTP